MAQVGTVVPNVCSNCGDEISVPNEARIGYKTARGKVNQVKLDLCATCFLKFKEVYNKLLRGMG